MAKKSTRKASVKKKSAPKTVKQSNRLNLSMTRISNQIQSAKGSEQASLKRQLTQLIASAPIVVRFTNRDFVFQMPKAARRFLRHSGYAVATINSRVQKGNQSIWTMGQKFVEGRDHVTNAMFLKQNSPKKVKHTPAKKAHRQTAAAAA